MEISDLQSKFIGALIGSALGDCIGELAFRFHECDDLISEISNRISITYTDDTAMAIGLAESILENDGEIIPEKLGQTFHRNFNREPYRGYGSGPPSIFRTVENTGENYVEVAQRLFGGEGSYGNGASMRITPLGVFFYDSKEIYEIARKSAIVTHSHEYGIDAAAILAQLIAILIPKNPSIYSIQEHLNTLIDDLIEFAKTDEYEKNLQDVKDLLNSNASIKGAERKLGSNVLAMASIPFSIFSFFKNPISFRDCLLDTVLVSRDRDTVGAMVGGLLGSYLGIEEIPQEWILKLENREYIRKLAENLYDAKVH